MYGIEDVILLIVSFFHLFSGALPLLNSYYGKPDRVIHYSYILCNGNEQLITSCNKIIHSLEEGRQIYNEAEVAGVACNPASPTPEPTEEVCLPKPVGTGDMCVSGDIQLDDENGMLEYCINGRWSVFCQLTHSEATVACRQLGHVTYTCMQYVCIYIHMYLYMYRI